jgi:ADP-ribose pyrophosphatase YjhB (NUDIX family)|nr:NUDIX hydrolase [Gammaproteobacteria bacterium]MBP6050962.1 NUDIX hydrolase [Pseudomonadales bacterium]MBK6582469.1 NUDIX hydrolase [Gammaproteobacteria bacterium]MBK7169615.1 NUDIX hydrolase [Gammaproteobacteria bacterium]MBK7521264.1 NUDIX hydrolase [Gammaproteobacteria bacterium]
MKFCSSCGRELARRVPANDDRERLVCDHCAIVHYQNPRIVVGCLPVWEERVLLCRRSIAPRLGYWTLPAGFMENCESTLEGALRETWEEARARVRGESLYTIFDLPHISQVYMFYRAELSAPEYSAGPESSAVELFAEHEIPWDELAFPVINVTLERFFEDRRRGAFPVHSAVLRPQDWRRKG